MRPTRRRRAASAPAAAPGRPRDAALTDAILGAVLELVAEKGFHGMRTEDVARRVGTSKQALYRRWPGKAQLIAAAVRHALASANPQVPDRGSLRADLVALLSNTVRRLTTTPLGQAIAALIGELRQEELAACLTAVERERRTLMVEVLKRGQACGELAADRDLELDIDALLGTVYFRLLIRRLPVTPRLVEGLVDAWLGSAKTDGGKSTAPPDGPKDA